MARFTVIFPVMACVLLFTPVLAQTTGGGGTTSGGTTGGGTTGGGTTGGGTTGGGTTGGGTTGGAGGNNDWANCPTGYTCAGYHSTDYDDEPVARKDIIMPSNSHPTGYYSEFDCTGSAEECHRGQKEEYDGTESGSMEWQNTPAANKWNKNRLSRGEQEPETPACPRGSYCYNGISGTMSSSGYEGRGDFYSTTSSR